jgi:hypothetical protein
VQVLWFEIVALQNVIEQQAVAIAKLNNTIRKMLSSKDLGARE